MNVNDPRTNMIIVLVVSMIYISGCGRPNNLVQSGVYGVEESTPSGIKISRVTAYQDNDHFVVSGTLNRTSRNRSYPGHVDIAIVGTNGDVLAKTSVKNRMPFIGRSKRKTSSFRARFRSSPPDGSIIRVSFHRKGTTSSAQFDCSSNQAVENQDAS